MSFDRHPRDSVFTSSWIRAVRLAHRRAGTRGRQQHVGKCSICGPYAVTHYEVRDA